MVDTNSAPILPLFVFGTLRRYHENHHYLHGHFDKMLSARLNDYARVAPLMIAPKAGEVVDGELYFIKQDHYIETMARCDELEEIPPGQLVGWEYQRKRVHVVTAEGLFEAWAYVQPESL